MYPRESTDGSLDLELLRLENDPVYLEAQNSLFRRFFSVSELEDVAMATRDIVDSTVRQTLGRAFDRSVTRKLKWFSNIDQYPIGYCNDISHTVEGILRWGPRPSTSPHASWLAQVLAANFTRWNSAEVTFDEIFPCWVKLLDNDFFPQKEMARKIAKFERAGGVFGSVWGVRPADPSFQWAILVGDHVVDVAGDAMDRFAYPVSVEPLDSSQYRSIRSYEDYAWVARQYWGYEIYRNTLLPTIAPAFPIVSVDGLWNIRFERPEMLLKKSALSHFEISKQAWNGGAFENPPQEIQEAVWGIAPGADGNMEQIFENWAQASRDREDPEKSLFLPSMLRSAIYFAQKFEHDWQMNGIPEMLKKPSKA